LRQPFEQRQLGADQENLRHVSSIGAARSTLHHAPRAR
jgi:hypothetical protein